MCNPDRVHLGMKMETTSQVIFEYQLYTIVDWVGSHHSFINTSHIFTILFKHMNCNSQKGENSHSASIYVLYVHPFTSIYIHLPRCSSYFHPISLGQKPSPPRKLSTSGRASTETGRRSNMSWCEGMERRRWDTAHSAHLVNVNKNDGDLYSDLQWFIVINSDL